MRHEQYLQRLIDMLIASARGGRGPLASGSSLADAIARWMAIQVTQYLVTEARLMTPRGQDPARYLADRVSPRVVRTRKYWSRHGQEDVDLEYTTPTGRRQITVQAADKPGARVCTARGYCTQVIELLIIEVDGGRKFIVDKQWGGAQVDPRTTRTTIVPVPIPQPPRRPAPTRPSRTPSRPARA